MQGLKVDLIIKHIIQTEIRTFFCHVDPTTSPKTRSANDCKMGFQPCMAGKKYFKFLSLSGTI
jgi:hypothetical protein